MVGTSPNGGSGDWVVNGSFLSAYAEVAKSVGLEPFRHLRQAGLPATSENREELNVPLTSFLSLLERCGRIADRPDFTLLFVRRLTLSALGPIGLLMAAQPSVRAALTAFCRHATGPEFPFRARLEEYDGDAVVRLTPKPPSARGRPQASDLALGVLLRLMQAMLGPDWRPRTARLARAAPADAGPYGQLFGLVLFDQAVDAMTIGAADLDALVPTANPELARLVSRHFGTGRPRGVNGATEEVRELIRILLPSGQCTVERVADHLGVDRRTVHRRLASQGTSFKDLLQQGRREMIEGQLAARDRPLSAVATALGFANSSSFSRWFRLTYGVSPSRWRPAAPASKASSSK